jgi:hypothetical protein
MEIARSLKEAGVKTFALQECFDADRRLKYSDCFQDDFISLLRDIFSEIIVRKW